MKAGSYVVNPTSSFGVLFCLRSVALMTPSLIGTSYCLPVRLSVMVRVSAIAAALTPVPPRDRAGKPGRSRAGTVLPPTGPNLRCGSVRYKRAATEGPPDVCDTARTIERRPSGALYNLTGRDVRHRLVGVGSARYAFVVWPPPAGLR